MILNKVEIIVIIVIIVIIRIIGVGVIIAVAAAVVEAISDLLCTVTAKVITVV